MTIDFAAWSRSVLGEDTLPDDLAILLDRAEELKELAGITMRTDPAMKPWDDTSYLSDADRADPDISASVRAMTEINTMISFVAITEEDEYIGYWRGQSRAPLSQSPLVVLDNEGEYRLLEVRTLAEAIDEFVYDDDVSAEMNEWLGELGADGDDEDESEDEDAPDHADLDTELVNRMRNELYDRYRGG
jgi:hypothetical protein